MDRRASMDSSRCVMQLCTCAALPNHPLLPPQDFSNLIRASSSRPGGEFDSYSVDGVHGSRVELHQLVRCTRNRSTGAASIRLLFHFPEHACSAKYLVAHPPRSHSLRWAARCAFLFYTHSCILSSFTLIFTLHLLVG